MAPVPCARICCSSCFMHAQAPRRLIACTRSKLSAGSSAASLGRIIDPGVVERHVKPADPLTSDADPDQQLIIYTAEPGSRSEEALHELAAWAAEHSGPTR
jgi:hypothetical protein